MAQILLTEDGKRVEISKSKDTCLYSAPHNPPNTGTDYTRGTDLYAHKARSGKWYYYTYYWSMWQREEARTELVSREETIKFLQRKATLDGWGELDSKDIKQAVDHFQEDIFQEDA